ncbi:hypothetical protein [Streptomyces halstedii]
MVLPAEHCLPFSTWSLYFAGDGTDHASHKEQGQHDPPLHHPAEQTSTPPRTSDYAKP